MYDSDTERHLRREIAEFLSRVTNDQEHPVSKLMLRSDFKFNGNRFPIVDQQQGIRKAKGIEAAISILTKDKGGKGFNYTDGIGDDGLLRYSWTTGGHDSPRNVSVRKLIGSKIPIPWFMEVAHMEYQLIYPVYVVGEEPDEQRFIVALADTAEMYRPDSPVEAALRRYAIREAKARLHQPVFRSRVLAAYEDHCAICNLNHRELLDAAHIIPDSEDGEPLVRNGLCLCRIHHRAYDVKILGITPDYEVKIREDILAEIDGPMLEHGLKKLHNNKLMYVPTTKNSRPSRELLEVQYGRFLAA